MPANIFSLLCAELLWQSLGLPKCGNWENYVIDWNFDLVYSFYVCME